ncbi:hypothetical protein SAMN03159496_05597 [Rhizobium sp. NFR07]|nr:hypothetical protein SAMN03159496_05597 [Rhizobium sp. NFR07]
MTALAIADVPCCRATDAPAMHHFAVTSRLAPARTGIHNDDCHSDTPVQHNRRGVPVAAAGRIKVFLGLTYLSIEDDWSVGIADEPS